MAKVFISYSSKDKETVTSIKDDLSAVTPVTFLMRDYDVEGIAEQYVHDAINGINECDIFMFMLSEKSQLSEKPLMELTFAAAKQSSGEKKIYIVNIDGCPIRDSFLFRWGKYRTFNWNNEKSKEQLVILLKPAYEHQKDSFPKLHDICRNGKYGFVNHKGEVVIPCKWTAVSSFNEGLAVVDDSSGKYGFLDMKGNRVIPCSWDDAEPFKDGMAVVKNKSGIYDKNCGVIDKNVNLLIPVTYSSLDYIGEGMFKYYNYNSRYGILNRNNESLCNPCWFSIGCFSDGLCPVQDVYGDHKYGYIDRSGKVVIPYWWDSAYDFSEGLAVVIDKDRKYGVIDIYGKVVIPCYYKYLKGFYEGLCAFGRDDKIGFINKEDEIVIDAEWKTNYSQGFSCGRFLVMNEEKKYGYIDKSGSLVIPYTWDFAEDFEDGTAWVRVDDTWKLIDVDGNYV